jgi:drug/metabolite transporter (DMT)-like permease
VLAHFTWPHVAGLAVFLAFVGWVLWLTASNPDTSEIKSWVGIGAAFIARDVWLLARRLIQAQTDLYEQGGRAE